MENVLLALSDVFTTTNIFYLIFGVTLGVFIGAVPGLNGAMAVAIVVPLTYYLDSLVAITLLIGILKGSRFGGSICAILLNTPGSPEAAATCFDGYPLAKKGKPLKALKMALYSSVFGDTFSDLVLILVAAPIALVALKMGPAEITSIMIFALTMIALLSGKSLIKGIISGVFGILVACVGMEPMTATIRLTFGFVELQNGVPLMAIGIGLLALSEVIIQMEENLRVRGKEEIFTLDNKKVDRQDRIVTRQEFKGSLKTLVRSSLIGTSIGALPGLGVSLAAFLGYGAAKRASKNPEQFGKGALEGIAAAEAANSAVVGANLIPLFTLGIPGNVTAAMIIGAFMIHGVTPGPLIFQEQPKLIYGIYGSMLVADILNLAIGGLGIRIFAKLLQFPKHFVFPIITMICITGAFMSDNTIFAVMIMIIFAILGYIMKKLDFSFVAFIIGFVLGPMLELSIQQTMGISGNNLWILVQRPVSLGFLILTGVVIWRIYRSKKKLVN